MASKRQRRRRNRKRDKPRERPIDAAFREFLGAQHESVRWLWGTPRGRLILSSAFIALTFWCFHYALTDPDRFFTRRGALIAFLAAPLGLVMFVATAAQAVSDLLRGNVSLPRWVQIEWWLMRGGRIVAVVYLAVMGGALVWDRF
jgi:hypothetical protein